MIRYEREKMLAGAASVKAIDDWPGGAYASQTGTTETWMTLRPRTDCGTYFATGATMSKDDGKVPATRRIPPALS